MNDLKSAIPLLKLICDETRLDIMTMLSRQEMNGCQINRAFCYSQPTISYHMKLLVDSGLALARKEGSAVMYSANMALWPGIADLLQLLGQESRKDAKNE